MDQHTLSHVIVEDMDRPLFSIVILARGSLHLIPLTLDTLKFQNERDFEVLVISNAPGQAIYSDLPVQWRHVSAPRMGEMMNEAIHSVRGRYLQFLNPGDRFLSCQGLSYLRQLIQEGDEPDLVYSGFLMRDPDEPPQAASFPINQDTLQRGMFPAVSRTSWFLRETLVDLGGFDETFKYRSTFDFLCRLHQMKDFKVAYSRRVLTDSEPHSTSPREMVGYAQETCRIICRHFGLWHALRWIFVQDHLKMLRWSIRLVKKAFWKSE